MFCTFIKEKLRQLRDNIIGKRPEDENACGEWQLPATQKWECDWVENVELANPDRFQFKSTHLLPSHSLARDSVSLVHSLPSTQECSTAPYWPTNAQLLLFNLWLRLSCSSAFSLFILWAIYNHCPLYIQRGRPFLVHSSSHCPHVNCFTFSLPGWPFLTTTVPGSAAFPCW